MLDENLKNTHEEETMKAQQEEESSVVRILAGLKSCTPLNHRCLPSTTSDGMMNEAEEAAASSSNPSSGTGFFHDVSLSSKASSRTGLEDVSPLPQFQSVSGHISDDSGSDRVQSLPMPRKAALKSSLFSDVTPRSKVAKHVQFTFKDHEIRYEVTKDDIKKSWLDIDVSRAIEATENESHDNDMMVSFGPTGRFTTSDMDVCKDGKEYMVRIQKSRLINEMLGQRTNLRQSVLEEQAHQKREGVVDAEEICLVASKHCKWGVELAKSSWWLYRT